MFVRTTGGWSKAAVACLGAAGACLALLMARNDPLDLSIYAWGGHAVLHDAALYGIQAHGLWFTYPPFAAFLFIPLATLPAVAVRVCWALASLAAVWYICRACFRLSHLVPSPAAVTLVVAAVVTLEPVRHTFALGQVNLLLMALVLWDVERAAATRPAGIGVGLAAAVKLTPALFIVLLLLSGRRQTALIAAGTFAAGGAAGALVAPAASSRYWLHLFYDTGRQDAAYISNQSPFGAAARLLGGPDHVGSWYAALAVLLAVAGIATASAFARHDDWLAAVAAAGLTTLLVSPISWTHHWVWAIPALFVLVRDARRHELIAAAGSYLVFVAAPMWWTWFTWMPHYGYATKYGVHGVESVLANSYVIAGVILLGCLGRRALSTRAGQSSAPPVRYRRLTLR